MHGDARIIETLLGECYKMAGPLYIKKQEEIKKHIEENFFINAPLIVIKGIDEGFIGYPVNWGDYKVHLLDIETNKKVCVNILWTRLLDEK